MKGIASSGAPKTLLCGWMDGWVDGWESRVKDCLQQSKIVTSFDLFKFVNTKQCTNRPVLNLSGDYK
jgi:hypothetical protein